MTIPGNFVRHELPDEILLGKVNGCRNKRCCRVLSLSLKDNFETKFQLEISRIASSDAVLV